MSLKWDQNSAGQTLNPAALCPAPGLTLVGCACQRAQVALPLHIEG